MRTFRSENEPLGKNSNHLAIRIKMQAAWVCVGLRFSLKRTQANTRRLREHREIQGDKDRNWKEKKDKGAQERQRKH